MKRLMVLLALMAALPAFAQRGGGSQPLKNYAETCSVYGTVSDGVSCSGYPKQWCVNYDTNFIYACNPTTGVWDAVGSASGGTGGSGTIAVRSNGGLGFLGIDLIDFYSEFAITDLGNGDVAIQINDNVLTPAMGNATGTLAIANGGTGSTTATAARLALGAAASGSNSDITALNNLTTPLPPVSGGTGVTTSTGLTDKVFVGISSTAGAYTAIPDCDATGNQLGFVAASHSFECAADGSGGSGIEASEEGTDVTAAARSRINFIGAAITAADNSGSSRIDVTLAQTPASASVVGSGRTLTGGAGIASLGDLTADRTIATASTEAGFITDGGAGVLSPTGAGNEGKMQVLDNGTLQYTDGAGTLQRAALAGDGSGRAFGGDSPIGFFPAGNALETGSGGTGATSIGSDTQCLFNDGGVVGADGGCTYVKGTDTLTVGTLVTSGAADNARYVELQTNSGDVATPTSGFSRAYFSGAAGSEVPKYKTVAGTVFQFSTLTGSETLTNKTLTTPIETGKIDRNNVAVDDDDCTGEQGLGWYDTTDSAFEFCNANSGAPATLAASSGDITDVWQTASGDASAIVGTAGDSLDASGADFLRVPYGAAPTVDATGKVAVDSTAGQLLAYSGAAITVHSAVRSTGAVLESLVSTDDNYEFFEAPDMGVTVTGVSCRCRGTCSTLATFTLEDRGGNAMTITGTNPTCSTTGNSTYAAVTAGNALVAGEGLAFDVTNTPTTGDTYTITVTYTVDRQ